MAAAAEHAGDVDERSSSSGKTAAERKRQRVALASLAVGVVVAVIGWLAYRKQGASAAGGGYTYPTGLTGAGNVAGQASEVANIGQAVEQLRAQLAGAGASSPIQAYDDSWMVEALAQLRGEIASIPIQNQPRGSTPAETNTGGATTQVGSRPPYTPQNGADVLPWMQIVQNQAPPAPSTYYTPSALDHLSSQPGGLLYGLVPAGGGRGTSTVVAAPTPIHGTGPVVDTSRGGRLIADERYVDLGGGRYQVVA